MFDEEYDPHDDNPNLLDEAEVEDLDGDHLDEQELDEADAYDAKALGKAKQAEDPEDPGAPYCWRIAGLMGENGRFLAPLPPLSPEEACAALARGDTETLIRSVLRLVRSCATEFRRKRAKWINQRLAEAVAFEGACKAAETWVPGRGTKWSTWAYRNIEWALKEWQRDNYHESAHVSTVTQTDDETGSPSARLDDAVGHKEDEGALDEHRRFPKPRDLTIHRQRRGWIERACKQAAAKLGWGLPESAGLRHLATGDIPDAAVETAVRTGRAPDGMIEVIQARAGCGSTRAKKAWRKLAGSFSELAKLDGADEWRESLHPYRGPVRRRRGKYWC